MIDFQIADTHNGLADYLMVYNESIFRALNGPTVDASQCFKQHSCSISIDWTPICSGYCSYAKKFSRVESSVRDTIINKIYKGFR